MVRRDNVDILYEVVSLLPDERCLYPKMLKGTMLS